MIKEEGKRGKVAGLIPFANKTNILTNSNKLTFTDIKKIKNMLISPNDIRLGYCYCYRLICVVSVYSLL